MSAVGRIGLAVMLLVGAGLAGIQMAKGNELGDDAHCPPAPTLVIDGTVLEVDVPRARCWPEIVGTRGETCVMARVASCSNGATATIQLVAQSTQTLPLIPLRPGSPRVSDFRICALPPGAYDVTLCADDPEPIACGITVATGQTVDVRSRRPLPTVHVRVKVDAVVIGEAGSEVTFASGARPHRVGERGRFELHRTVTIADPPMPSEYAERDCYQRQPAAVTGRGCAGCSSSGVPGWIGIAAVVALLRWWRR